MRVSRAKVVRLLQAVREDGTVKIRVAAQGAERIALERQLVARFRLSDAIVVASPAKESGVATAIGGAAATWLGARVRDGIALGLGWGETLDALASRIGVQPLRRAAVVSLLGGMTHSRGLNPSAVARRVADALHAECYQLTAPILVSGPKMRSALWREPALRELRTRARTADVAIVSVGDVSERATLFREGLLTPAERVRLVAAGAVGDVLGHFLDASGRVVDDPVADRIIAVDLADLARARELVLASGGMRKVAALAAALKALRVTTLVTDEAAARGLLGGAA
jgi:DNA-binding transcriptional regulator LsrR (DeoR family)